MHPSPNFCYPWPWIEGEDEGTCLDVLADLFQAGTLDAENRVWLTSALKQGAGGPPGIATPWAAWALRLGERTDLPVVAGVVAISVTILNTRGSAPAFGKLDESSDACPPSIHVPAAPAEVMRWPLVTPMFMHTTGEADALTNRVSAWLLSLGECPAAWAPKNPPARTPFAEKSALPSFLRSSCGVREAIALWTLPVLLVDEDLAPWVQFGRDIAMPITLLGDLVRLWFDPDARDIHETVLTPLIEVWLQEPELGTNLLRAYAGERKSAIRHSEIRRLLASEAYRVHLEGIACHTLATARNHLPPRPRDLRGAAAEFIDALGRHFRSFDALLAFRDLLDPHALRGPGATPTDQWSAPDHVLRGRANTDACMAVAFLSETAPWPGSWGPHRFGVFGSQDQPVGQWFVRGLILRTLLEMGQDVREQAARLLREIPPGELRYFESWPGIPPDADSLGVMLELVALTGAARESAETWIALLPANSDEHGIVPVYFYRDPGGRPTTPSDQEWPGNDCNAVRLNLLCGLLAFDAARFHEVIQANAARVLACSDGDGVAGLFHYGTSYAAFAFLRFAQLYHDKAIDQPHRTAVAAIAAAIRARAATWQRLDGGWGSPQRTAFCLQGCAMQAGAGDTHALLLERGLRYLGEHQLVDGSWPAEPLYVIPTKHGRDGYHQGRALTTAFCVHALHTALTALAG